ncbi:zinc finger BED domain-containing protein 1 [Austrofundulus limnaeus]|uniref:Zinc finger BED domain-containing protein 1 n=1 Tax=Austrofundulus limnaeus TaxID=52670 RepID=A0A2I4B7Y9_AUSLI|nr:PREDICTED: zinc finger BED domain-containing protein 1-like [Austrofundulus limnaeus]
MKRGAKRRSSVWTCFEQLGKNWVRCKKCHTTLKYCGGATTSMMAHMTRHLPIEPLEEEDDDEKLVISAAPRTEEDSSSEAAHGASASPNTNTTASPPPEREQGERKRTRRSSVWDIFIKEDNEVRCTICDTKLKYMSSTTSMMYHIKNKHAEKDATSGDGVTTHAEVTELICRMIEKDMFPISVVNGDGFRELLAHTVHGYKMPSADDIAHSIEYHYQEKAEKLLLQMRKVEKMSLTVDFWAALPFQKYMTISCSFITEDWQGRSAVVHTHKLPSENHNTESITELLLSTAHSWGIAEKVITCVHNGTEKIWAHQACTSVNMNFVTCFATTLQRAVTDGLSEALLQIVAAAGRLVQHFTDNILASEALEQKQMQMCLPQHKLIKSSRARWDTICDMFERLLVHRWAIKAILSDRTVTSRQEAQALEIEDDCWQMIENFTPVLATLKWATTVISAETEASISNIYPITFSLIQIHLVPKENDVEQVLEFKLKVQNSLRKNMDVDSCDLASKPALIASMLDPRHKHLSFLTPAGRLTAKVKLHELVSKLETAITASLPKDEQQEIPVTPDISQMAQLSKTRSNTKNTMAMLLGSNYSSSYATDSEAQVDYYLRDIAPSLDINPLDWWRVNGPRFPKVATLAKHYLCIPGISLPPLLSEAGETFATNRTRLSPEHVNMIIFVNRNT